MDGIVNYFKQVRDKVVREHDDQVFSKGFDEAANLCVGLLTAKLDELLGKMKTGALSSEEQRVFAELSELKAEMERRLYAYSSSPEDY